MMPDSQVLLSVGIPTIAILIGILINNRQIERLEKHLDGQIGSVRSEIDSVRNEVDSVRNEVGSLRSEIGSVRNEVGSLRNEIASLRNEMNARFEAAHQALIRVEGVMDARLRHLEESR